MTGVVCGVQSKQLKRKNRANVFHMIYSTQKCIDQHHSLIINQCNEIGSEVSNLPNNRGQIMYVGKLSDYCLLALLKYTFKISF